MGAPALIIVVMWCLPGGHCGCAPIIVVAMGAPTRPRGHVVPPWSSSWPSSVALVAMLPCSSLWSCGALAIVVTMGALEAVGAPLVVLVAMRCHPLIFMVVWTPPGHCRGSVVHRGHWCPLPLILIAVGALEAVGVPPVIPWCPAWPLVLPGHRGGRVVAMWCPPARPHGHVVPPLVVVMWCPPPGCRHGRSQSSSAVPPHLYSWLCGAPLVVLVAVWCLLVLMVMWTSPGHCCGRVVPPGHWCPPLLILVTVGALEAMGVPVRPLVPRSAVGAPQSLWWMCRGHVVSPRSLSWSWCPLPLVLIAVGACRLSSRVWVHGAHPTPQPPHVGHGCSGHFVVVMVVMEMKGRAVNRENTYYIRMPHHDPAD